jgi:RNA polymerase-binding protein DksA
VSEQLEYFRQKLLQWREDLIEESRETITHLQHEVRDVGDEAERATRETENSLELRTRDRYRKLIRKIDKALNRIEEGEYGYCEETGEEIGIERLEARPIALYVWTRRSAGNCGSASWARRARDFSAKPGIPPGPGLYYFRGVIFCVLH